MPLISRILVLGDFSEADQTLFWSRVDVEGGVEVQPGLGKCWPWLGTVGHDFGYGELRLRTRLYRAHRLALLFTAGSVVGGRLVIQHLCDVPACVRPSHLMEGTQKQNMRGARERGRFVPPITKENRHLMTGENAPNKKLDWEKVRKIRAMRAAGCGLDFIADIFGICRTNVWQIETGKTWKE